MSVHKAISEHSTKQHLHLVAFAELDNQREMAIEECINLCKRGLPFSVDRINTITKQINQHAKKGISPLRQLVTEQMVRDYANKI